MKLLLIFLIFSLRASAQEAPAIYRWFNATDWGLKIQCSHIYVAIQPDTLVWDRTPRTFTLRGGGSWTLDSAIYNHHYFDPAPSPIKIICILCHKQTEQKIKIINEVIPTKAVPMPCSSCDSLSQRLLREGRKPFYVNY